MDRISWMDNNLDCILGLILLTNKTLQFMANL